MALAENWEQFIRLYGGEVGAREVFEKAIDELLRVENPGKEVHIVKASQGDGGIDVYVHQPAGIDVYQCKFFMGSMNLSRWNQVKKAFDRAVTYLNSDEARGVKLLRWSLCMPREMQKEDIAFWKQFSEESASYGPAISVIDGNEIIQRMQKCDRMRGTDFISRYFTVPENVRNVSKSIPKCLTPIPTFDRQVGLVGREEAVKRVVSLLEKDNQIVWISGMAGIGKTTVMQWLCNDLKEKGQYVAWIYCGKGFREDLLELKESLDITEINQDIAYRMIMYALKTRLDGSLYLFMDNMSYQLTGDEIKDLTSLNVYVMITSRYKNNVFPNVNLDILESEEALAL